MMGTEEEEALRPLYAGKWADEHVRLLGVLEHLEECCTLHRQQAIRKAEGRRKDAEMIKSQFWKELGDLWVILEIARRTEPSFAATCLTRARKFKP